MPELRSELPAAEIRLKAFYLRRAGRDEACILHFRSREILTGLLERWEFEADPFLVIKDELGISHRVDPKAGILSGPEGRLCSGCAGRQAAE